MRFICILAMPRTGSSHVNKLLKSIAPINAKSELFHVQQQVNLSKRELAAFATRGAPVNDEPSFIAWRHEHPVETLEAILAGGRGRFVAFKLFPGHLPRATLRAELFPRDDMAFVVLRRRPIECFISGVKARSVSTFTKRDTTAIKPKLSGERFVEWAKRMRMWYRWLGEELEARGRPFGEISYERHLDGKSGEESLAYIVPMLRSLGFSQLGMPFDVIEGERQDQEPRYQDRVANWQAFEDELKAVPAHAKLLSWAAAST